MSKRIDSEKIDGVRRLAAGVRYCACAALTYKAGCSSSRDVTCCFPHRNQWLTQPQQPQFQHHHQQQHHGVSTSCQLPVSQGLGLHRPGRNRQSRLWWWSHAGGNGKRDLWTAAAEEHPEAAASTDWLLGRLHARNSLWVVNFISFYSLFTHQDRFG